MTFAKSYISSLSDICCEGDGEVTPSIFYLQSLVGGPVESYKLSFTWSSPINTGFRISELASLKKYI